MTEAKLEIKKSPLELNRTEIVDGLWDDKIKEIGYLWKR